jgi:site-specific DNA-cytosine methylase
MSLAKNSSGNSIETACAIDIWEIACKTFEHNLGMKPICEPIDDELIRRVDKINGPFDIVVGGPPCQVCN